jgi:hypothetical protein
MESCQNTPQMSRIVPKAQHKAKTQVEYPNMVKAIARAMPTIPTPIKAPAIYLLILYP